jgi:hypothetical protein
VGEALALAAALCFGIVDFVSALLASRIASVGGRTRPGADAAAARAGVRRQRAVGTLAIACYTLATREQMLAVAVVLAALYPVVPVLLWLTVLRERLTRTQAVGLGMAGAAVGLIALAG